MAMLNPRAESGTDAVPAGYKRTEVGIIPEDWHVVIVGAVTFVTKLAGFEYTRYFNYAIGGSIIAIRGLNIKDGRIDLNNIHTIPKSVSNLLPRSKLVQGDIVITYVGTIGQSAVIPEDNLFHLGPNVAKISVNRRFLNPFYLCCYLNSFQGQKRIIEASASTTQAALSMSNLRSITIIQPPMNEQRAIAEALSDTDALITALDRLIAKKRAIKQATMQQLLTGKTRLPGFDGEWEQKILGDVIERIIGGGTPSRTIPTYWNGDIPWVTVKDFTSFDPYSAQEYITKQGFINSATNLILAGNLIIATRMALGKAVVYEVDVCINQDLKALILKKEQVFVHYLYYWFEKNAHTIDEIGSGSTVKGLSINDLRSMLINVPSIDEQHAIATVLSDMDAELHALEQRRAKTIQIKQGMMQQLLTGRIRLRAPLAEEDA